MPKHYDIGNILGNKPEVTISTSELQADNPSEWVKFLRQVNEEGLRQYLLKRGIVIQSEADWSAIVTAINDKEDITGKLISPKGKPIIISLMRVMQNFPVTKKQIQESKILFV